MDTYAASFLHLLREISEAISRRKESESDFNNFLRKIFAEGDLHDTKHADPRLQSNVELEHLEKVLGREHEKRKLLHKCCYPDETGIQQLSAIPILGANGIGKTTLARQVYEDELVKKHFEMRVWVKVDGLELKLHHAAQELLKSTMGMACAIDDQDELDEMVRDSLLGRRCLIVFDGVESMTEDLWLHMKNYWFDFVDLGSKVLITTLSAGVANLVAKKPFELNQLLPYDGWSLCGYISFHSLNSVKDMSRHVVECLTALCGYNPVLLKLVGSMMRFDDKLRNLLSSVHFSDAFIGSTFDASVVILVCVWALPPQLRQCLAFCAVFPKGYALDREKIINMWAAHGLVKQSPKHNLHDIGDSYFHQLLCRSFFTDIARNEYGDVSEFRIPGLIHPIMQDVAKIVWNGKVGAIGSISEDAHQVSVHLKGPEDVTTLIFSCTLYSGGSSSLDYSFLDFQELESLDLSCSGIRNLSGDICALRELKYLNLSYTLIETLPNSFAELSQLQTLDLSWCYHFKLLPKGMCNLVSMSHLDMSQCESLSYSPSGIGFLISLTSMPLLVLGKDRDSARLGELGLLNQLRGRLEIRNLENVTEISEARNAKLYQKIIRHLGLCWSKDADNCFELLELLEPNQQLKVFDITGYMSTSFPKWISSISHLIKISITDCGCKELPPLGQLPLLKELQLKGMTSILYIGAEFYGDGFNDAFPSLEQLGLYDMPILFEWSGAGPATESGSFLPIFPSIRTLTIEGCPRLLNIPPLGNLLDLIVLNNNDEILSALNQTRYGSLSSLLIKNMGLGTLFMNSSTWQSLKKLILFNGTKHLDSPCLMMQGLTVLEHLAIVNCPQVRDIILHDTISIHKLHVADCQNLRSIHFNQEAPKLTELVFEGCPELYYPIKIINLRSLTKLLLRDSGNFIVAEYFEKLEKLQYLSICECPWLEKELLMEPSPISHIPCVVLGSHSKYRDRKDSEEIATSASFESYNDPQQNSTGMGSSSVGRTIAQIKSIFPVFTDLTKFF